MATTTRVVVVEGLYSRHYLRLKKFLAVIGTNLTQSLMCDETLADPLSPTEHGA